MKLFSTSIEIAVLKTICSGGKVGDWLLGVADPYLFHTEAGMQTIGRIRKILSTASSVPQWSAILHDPVLSVSVRSRLAKSKAGKYSQSKAENAIQLLRTYAAMRKFAGMAAQITTDLEKDSVDIESISDYIAEIVGQVRLGSNTAHMYKFGEGNNTDHIIEDLLTGEGEKGIPTCFQTWDKINGTIPNSAVMLIGSSSGGGKSIMAASMCRNMAENGMRPCVIPLEMSVKEMAARLLSGIAKVSVHKILQGTDQLDSEDIKRIVSRFRKWTKKCKKVGGSYLLYEPATSLTMEQALHSAKAYGPSCIILDYAALLEDVDGENDWRKLSEVVRDAKRFARMHDIPVIVLVQISNSLELLYSKRMLHDADIAWFWHPDKAAKETGVINIQQTKSRNRNPFPFKLCVEWEYTYVRDMTDRDSAREMRYDKQVKMAGKSSKQK